MQRISGLWTPQSAARTGEVAALLILAWQWFTGNYGAGGFIVLLLLGILTLARWRFALPHWSVLLDQTVCVVGLAWWPEAWYGLVLPLFEAGRRGKLWHALPTAALLIAHPQASFTASILLLAALFVGWIVYCWSEESERLLKAADRERRDRYELEILKGELLAANAQAAHAATLAERHRISLKLHDNVGHELTAALLALQAFEQLWKEQDPEAGNMFVQAQKRLVNSARELRETVHDMKPIQSIGVNRLEETCRSFAAFPIDLQIDGDTSRVETHLWSILESCLKEALTNAARHAKARRVEVELDVSEHIVRLSVYNDGYDKADSGMAEDGIGLRNLRQRARAAGGSISIDAAKGFRLVCVLPLGKEVGR